MSDSDLTVVVLSSTESQIGFLNPKYVQITETNELYMLRSITIVQQLLDEDNGEDLSEYDTLLVHGNKLWLEQTPDGDSCLYVIRGPKIYDFENNTVSLNAMEVAVELGEFTILTRGSGTFSVTTFLNSWSNLFTEGIVKTDN